MEPRRHRPGDAPHHGAGRVGHGEHDRRALLALLFEQRVPAGVGRVPALGGDLLLALLARLLARLQLLLQEVGEHGAEGRVRGEEEGATLRGLLVPAERPALDVPPGLAHGEEQGLALQPVGGDVAQRGVVVQDVEAAPEGGADEVVLPALDGEVAEGDVRRAAAELHPLLAAVDGEEDAELRPEEEQLGADVVLDDAPQDLSLRQVTGDRGPGPAAVGALQQVRGEVARLVVVDDRVDGIGVEEVGLQVVDEELHRHARQPVDLAPAPAAVLGHLDQPVVGAGVEQPLDQRRLGERGDRPVVAHRAHVPGRVEAPDPPHHRLRQAVQAAGEVAADRSPGVAAVIAAPYALAGVVDPRRQVRADQDRRVPVEAVPRLVLRRLRLDVDDLAGAPVVADQVPLLPLGVDDVGIPRLDGGLVAVGEDGDEPIAVADPVDVVGAYGSTLGAVVLRTAVDVVEGLVVVDGQLVELRHRQVGDELPVLAQVPSLVEAAVAADQEVVRVLGIEDHGVVVAVLVLVADVAEGRPAVVGDLQPDVRVVDAVEDVRAGPDLLVVVRAGPGRDHVAALLPVLSTVRRAPEAAGALAELDPRVEDVRVLRRDRQPDLAHLLLGQPLLQPAPGLAAVGRLVDPRLGAAVHQRCDVAEALVGRGVEHVGIARIADHVVHAGVLPGGEDRSPGLAGVGRLVQAALTARRPERPLHGDDQPFRVARVDEDLRDVLGRLEPAPLPALSSVATAVDPVAVADVSAADVLPGPDPDRLRVPRVDGDTADRVRALIVEDRCPGGPCVGRLPDVAAAHGDDPGALVLRGDGDVGDAPRHQRGPDAAQLEPFEGLGGHARLCRLVGFLGGDGRGCRRLGALVRGDGGARRSEKDEDRHPFHGKHLWAWGEREYSRSTPGRARRGAHVALVSCGQKVSRKQTLPHCAGSATLLRHVT